MATQIERVPLVVPVGGIQLRGRWKARFRNPARRRKTGTIYGWDEWFDEWHTEWTNLVVAVGVDHILDVGLSGGAQDTTWFIGLTDGTPTIAAADTMSSHSGWVEVTAYDEATRQAWVDGGVSVGSVSNSGSPATFTISTNSTTIGGSFLVGVDTKGGTGGVLYAAGAFGSGDVTLNQTATIDISASFTAADDSV